VRAINLIPSDSRRTGITPSLGRLGGAHVVLAVLVVALAYVTVYVLTSNTISQRKSQLASLNQQISLVQTGVTRLNNYAQFERLAKQRADTVRQIAATRFDWHAALSDLSKVVPANTSLQSLTATAASGMSAGSSGGGSGGGIRGAINAPAFELSGCTASQDDVAQLMSRLRLINGVTRVTLQNSTKAASSTGTTVARSGSSTGSAGACSASGPSFTMVVFFQPVASGAPASGQPVGTTTGATK
jgi:Tfp pilus assembly protein PilN